jgi:hypothetical protein
MRLGRTGEQIFSELHGRYYEQAVRGKLFMAQAIVTAPVIYTTAAGTGGPLLWNPPTSGVNAVILAVSMGITVVTTVAAALGLTGNTGQSSRRRPRPRSTAAATCFSVPRTSACTPYRIGTVTTAGAFLLPFASLHTGALTVDTGVVGLRRHRRRDDRSAWLMGVDRGIGHGIDHRRHVRTALGRSPGLIRASRRRRCRTSTSRPGRTRTTFSLGSRAGRRRSSPTPPF